MQSDAITREKEPERLKQMEAIREQATMLHGSRLNMDKPTEESVAKTMRNAVVEYMTAVDQDKEDGLDPDTARLWKEQVQEIVTLGNLDMPAAGTRGDGPEPVPQDGATDCSGPPQGRHRPGAVHRGRGNQGADRSRGDSPARVWEAAGELEEGDHGPEQEPGRGPASKRGNGSNPIGK